MKTLIWPLFVLVVLSIGFLIYAHDSSAKLPDQVATHFGIDGTPDGWMSREDNFLVVTGLGLGTSWFLASIGLISFVIPARFFNVPNRDYWFSPERKKESSLFFLRYMIWFGCLMIGFFAGVQYTMVKANLSSPVKMPNELFWSLFFGFLVAITIWTIALIQHFQKIENNEKNWFCKML